MKKSRLMMLAVALSIMAIVVVGCSNNDKDDNGNNSTNGAEVSYNIVEIEDASWALAVRKSVRLATNPGLTQQQIEWLAQDVVEYVSNQQPVNAIMIFIYHNNDDYYGLARVVVDWAPYGDWSRADEVETGDYSLHQYLYR